MDAEEPLIGSCQGSHSEHESDKENDTNLSTPKDSRIKIPSRKIVVEPVLIILAVSGFALQLTVSLYTYRRFQEDAANELGINMSSLKFSEMHCSVNKSTDVYKLSQVAQTKNSYFNIAMGAASAVPNFISAIFLGPYSDKAGRRYAIVLPLIGSLLYGGVCLLVTGFKFSVWYLLIGHFIDGLSGRYIVLLIGCFAYIADITAKEDRRFRITIVEFIMFFSAVLGPIGVGYWIEHATYFWPITAAVGMTLVNVLYALLFIPETIIKDPNAKFFTVDHLTKIVRIYTDDSTPGRKWKLRLLYLAFMPVVLCSLGDNISTLFLQNTPLCWQSVKIGDYLAISTAIALIGGLIFAKLAKFCIQNHTVALISAFSSVLRNTYNAFVINDWMMYMIPVFLIFAYLCIPTVRAMMSNLVHPSEQGAVFASIALSEVVASLVGNVIFSAVYANTISIMSGFVYFFEAGFYAIATAILFVYVVRLRKERRQEQLDSEKAE